MSKLRILLVEESEDDAALVRHKPDGLGDELSVLRVETADALSAALGEQAWDVVISDYRMPRFSGLAAQKLVREHSRELPFIIVSSTIGEEIAVEAMRAGANDYVMKGNLAQLVPPSSANCTRPESGDRQSRRASGAAGKARRSGVLRDSITGLANRSLFLERLTQYLQVAAAGKHKRAVGLIDLERFKHINDSLGQASGDALNVTVKSLF